MVTEKTFEPFARRLDEKSPLDQRVTAGQFALEIMHEIRNPLETLANLNYLIRQVADDADQVRSYALQAEEQIETLSRIATQTLGFARLSEAARPVDLVDLAEAALRIHQKTVAEKRIHLKKRLPADLVAEVQQGMLLQVISNLIGNALYALPEEGNLTLRLRRHANHVDIVVADNGCGIKKEHLDLLFQPFFTTKDAAGNGLGLSLSKSIVDDHHGKILLRSSVRPGRSGTVFKVCLPASAEHSVW